MAADCCRGKRGKDSSPQSVHSARRPLLGIEWKLFCSPHPDILFTCCQNGKGSPCPFPREQKIDLKGVKGQKPKEWNTHIWLEKNERTGSSKLPGSSPEWSFPALSFPVDFLTLHSRNQNYFLLLLSGTVSLPLSHYHHGCFVCKKPSSIFPCVFSTGGMRAVCSVALLTWPSSLLSFGPILHLVWILASASPLLFGPRIHIPLPSSVSFPLRCFLDITCIPAAVSCWIRALFSVL